MKILIVDDDDISTALIQKHLIQAGHEVLCAEDGSAALDRLHGDTYLRMVITDWDMPRVNGLELCKQIRAMELSGYVYIILLTGFTDKQKTIEGIAAGADDFLTKPFDPGELLVRVRAGERVLALETRDLTIFALAKLAETRDQETGFHLERVREYARVLSQELLRRQTPGVNAGFVRLIYETSPLHDIGKVAIPDTILCKPGKLTTEEFDVMKTHTTLGARTLEAALRQHPEATFLRMARDIAGSHHERFDGTGYPQRLKGSQIPLSARIVSVCDTYDALTSKRVYKPALPHGESARMIQESAESQFDPLLVRVFGEIHHIFDSIRSRLCESRTVAPIDAAQAACP